MRRVAVVFACLAGVLAIASPAFGHGDLQGTSPEHGSRLGKAPPEISITLTEPPTKGAEALALDGCQRRVSRAVAVEGNKVVLPVQGGEPGMWHVNYRAVSAVDGHQTRGAFHFKVAGKKRCDRGGGEDDEIDAPGNPGIVDNPNPPDEGGTTWLLWVAGGTVLVAAAAFFVRRSSQ